MPVRLTDIFEPEVYGTYYSVNNTETNAFFQAGAATTNPYMDALASQPARQIIVPFWNDIDPTIEPNYSNDDPADLAVPQKINSGSQTARKIYVNQSFSAMDLARELSSQDPLQHIKDRFGTYWQRVKSRQLLAIMRGIMVDSVNNHGSDMVLDISGNDGDAAIFNAGAYIDAQYTIGDQVGSLNAIAVHSSVEARMVKNDEIQFIQDSQGSIVRKAYKGATVIVDDTMPIITLNGKDSTYMSVLFGSGAVGFGETAGTVVGMGEGEAQVPAEAFRTIQAGNGGGMEEIIERYTWMMHPLGYSWYEAPAGSPAGTPGLLTEFSPTYADLADPTHWSRIVPRKNIPVAFLISKA